MGQSRFVSRSFVSRAPICDFRIHCDRLRDLADVPVGNQAWFVVFFSDCLRFSPIHVRTYPGVGQFL